MAEYQAPTHAVLTVTPNNPQDLPPAGDVEGDPFALVGWPTDTPTGIPIDWDNATPYLADSVIRQIDPDVDWLRIIEKMDEFNRRHYRATFEANLHLSCADYGDRLFNNDPYVYSEYYQQLWTEHCVTRSWRNPINMATAAAKTAATQTKEAEVRATQRESDERWAPVHNPVPPNRTEIPGNKGTWSGECRAEARLIRSLEMSGTNMGSAKRAWQARCGNPCQVFDGRNNCLF